MKKRILSGLISLAMAAALIPAAAAETTTFEYTFDFNDTSVLPAAGTDFAWANGGREVPAGSVAGPSGEAGDYAFGYVPAQFGNYTTGESTLHRYSNGLEFLFESLNGNPIADTSFVMSVDFMYRNQEDMIAYILSPRMTPLGGKTRQNAFPLAIKLKQGGELVCVAEQKKYSGGTATTEVNTSAEIGTVAPYVWHNVAVKYTQSSTEGLYADVYLNGELRAQGVYCDWTNPITGFVSLSSSQTNMVLSQNGIRTAARNEQIYLDNLYVGTDLTKVDYDFGISAVENKRMDRLTVHFNQDIEAASAGDFIVSNSDGGSAASVTEATMIDARTVELQLDKVLEEYAEYAVMFMTDQAEAGYVSYSFTSQLAYFYDFNGSDTAYTPFSLNSKHNVRSTSRTGAYNTDSTDLDFTFVTHPGTNSDGSAMSRNKNGYNIYLTPDLAAFTSGTIQVNFDFKYDNETMFGWLVAPQLDRSLPNVVGFENNRLYCGATYADGVVLAPNTWYNITATYNFYDGGILTDVYLDGELVINDVFNKHTGGINAISTLVDAHTQEEYKGNRADDVSTRNEYFHMDNVYIGIDTDYRNSAFEIGFDGDDAVINAGIFNKAGTAVIALYDGQTLKEVKLYDFDLEQLDVETVSAAFDSYEEGNTIKLIALDGMQNLTPLIEAAVK